jgi:hypothetical protein
MRVTFSYPAYNLSITKYMGTPPNYQSLLSWLKTARKVIPQIPNPEQSDWFISQEVITLETVCLELKNSIGLRCSVIIERRKNQMVA